MQIKTKEEKKGSSKSSSCIEKRYNEDRETGPINNVKIEANEEKNGNRQAKLELTPRVSESRSEKKVSILNYKKR